MIIDGKKIADRVLDEIKQKLIQRTDPLRLALVYVADTKDARRFLEMKQKVGDSIGIESRIYELDANITTQEMRKKLVEMANAGVNDGVIVELPLPEAVNAQYVLNAIPENKDPDVLSQKAQGGFFVGRSSVLPPSVEAVRLVFQEHNVDVKGKNCAVFGYGLLIGRQIVHWLLMQGATVSVINKETKNPGEISILADVIIAGANESNIIKGDMVKEGVVVIDFGYEKQDKKIYGNVEFESVKDRASLITPVPGGVGPLVIAAALKNAVELSER